MQPFKQIIIGVVSALVSGVLVFGGYTLYAQGSAFSSASSSYHMEMNQYFNEKIAAYTTIVESGEITHPDLEMPQSASECTESNVTSFCTAHGAMEIFLEYMETLERLKGSYSDEGAKTQREAVSSLQNQSERITAEQKDIRLVLDAALSSYNEFLAAYPMHIQYEETIDLLLRYKSALSDVRDEVKMFPKKFIDAATSYCK